MFKVFFLAVSALSAIPIFNQKRESRCGIDWHDANSSCQDMCILGSDEFSCKIGSCFTSLDACKSPEMPKLSTTKTFKIAATAPPVNSISTPILTNTSRCGSDWENANSKCGTQCSMNNNCSSSEQCFLNLDMSPCSQMATISSEIQATSNSMARCGSDWEDANSKCGTLCVNSDENCTNFEKCFLKLDMTVCNSNTSTTVKWEISGSMTRCGMNWDDANSKCGDECNTLDNNCAGKEKCYTNLDVTKCKKNMSKAIGNVTRCGTSWVNANATCSATPCNYNDNDCGVNEKCFTNLELQSCSAKNNSNIVLKNLLLTNVSRCGTDWENANGKCGGTCMDLDNSCSNSEKCFTNLLTACGTNADGKYV